MTTATLHPPTRMSTGTGSWYGVVAIVLAVVATAGAASWITALSVRDWYPGLAKPTWTPPAWVFGPTWTILYGAMAVAASVAWVNRWRCADACAPLAAFAVQLLLNLAWTAFFFGLKSPLLGFLDICLLWVAIGVTVTQFFLVSRVAGWLMVPYWIWVTFAGALNAAIVLMGG